MTEKNSSKQIKNYKFSIITLFLLPLFLGLSARIILFIQLLNSPFRYYHTVRGLDMMTLLGKGENFIHGKAPFSPLNFLIYIAHYIFPAGFLPEGIVVLQMLIGLTTAIFCVWLTLSLSGNKYMALIAGMAASLYAPVLIYETQILKTTVYLFCSVLAFVLLIYAKKRQFSFFWTTTAGFAALFPLWERFAGILWPVTAVLWIVCLNIIHSFQNRTTFQSDSPTSHPSFSDNFTHICFTSIKSAFKPIIFFSCGMLISIIVVFTVNKYNNQPSSGYIKANFKYILSTGSAVKADINGPVMFQSETHQAKTSAAQKANEKILLYLKKAKDILSPIQIPNNINYYFVREKLPILKILPGPNLLIPLALTGFLILLLNFKFLRKESILFFYAFAFISPMFVFLPLARYKTIMLPLTAFASAYSIFYLIRLRTRKNFNFKNIIFVFCISIIYISVLISSGTVSRYSTDIYAYSYAAVNIPVKLMEKGKFKDAEKILLKYSREIPDASLITIFLSSSYMGQGRFKDAEYLLKNIPVPHKQNLKGRYFFNLADSVRLQKKNKEAALYYNQVLKTPYAPAISPNIKRFINHYLENNNKH